MSAAVAPPLRRWERAALLAVAVVLLGFAALVTYRSAYSNRRMTDFGVYARAAWAVRDGRDIYEVVDNNGWHYCYPPALAILLTPLADPYPGAGRAGYAPYAVGVVVWFLFGLACVAFAADRFARAVLPDEPRWSRRWWYARTGPVWVCLGGVGFTIARGQVNVLLVALVAGMFAATVRGRRTASGVWLAGAAALKVIPGYLVLFPLARRDGRALVGAAAGAVVLFGVLPALVWGVDGAIDVNRRIVHLVLEPGTTGGGDRTRAKELTNTTSTDSQSFVAAIHANLHPDRSTRPAMASVETRLAHWGIGAVLTLTTMVVGWRRLGRSASAADELVFLGALCGLMMLLTPVSHMHYYAMALPLVAGLWLRSLAARPGACWADGRTTAVLAAWGVATALPLLPGMPFDRLRENGFGVAASVLLWGYGLSTLGRRPATCGGMPAAGEAGRLAA